MLAISDIITDPGYLSSGIVHRHEDDCWWVFVDPKIHPLHVWKKERQTYNRSAQALGAAIFTNGTMMGKRLGPYKVTRSLILWEFTKWMSLGSIGGFIAGGPFLGIIGAVVGIAFAWRQSFTNWIPCGAIYSCSASIDDQRNFDGTPHAWIGRYADNFGSYCIDEGDLPRNVSEGLGGLVLLVKDFLPATNNRDFSQLHRKQGVVAWGLLPFNGSDGIIVVLGSRRKDCRTIADMLCSIGTRDAVAMDMSGCSMMGSCRRFMIGPLAFHRQAMQKYGLCCR